MKPLRDIDLMRLADGELDAEERAELEAALAADLQAADKLAGVQELGELVRGDLEIAADQAEPRFARMWSEIEKRMDLDEKSARKSARVEARPTGLWGRVTRWIDTYRGHVLTGALSAGAVAAVALVMRPTPPHNDSGQMAQLNVPSPIAKAPTPVVPVPDVVAVHQAAEIEDVDAPDGTATVFTIPDDDGEDTTTVIWVTPDDTVKGIQ